MNSKRISINPVAVRRLCEMYNLSLDISNQELGGYIERLIFEAAMGKPIQPQPAPQTPPITSPTPQPLQSKAPNLQALKNMVKQEVVND